MRMLISVFCLALAAVPANAQTHARHTAAHDSTHAIVLTDAQHLALHQFLLGRWSGVVAHGAAHDSLDIRFENDSLHQQLLVRHRSGISGFEIRGDTLRWKQDVSGSPCVASTPVSALLQAAATPTAKTGPIKGTVTCGVTQSSFTLRKRGK